MKKDEENKKEKNSLKSDRMYMPLISSHDC